MPLNRTSGYAVVALALADVAGDVDVGQKVHFDLDNAVGLAGLAAAHLDVEGSAQARSPRALLSAGRRTTHGIGVKAPV